jgi:hypothetical protein
LSGGLSSWLSPQTRLFGFSLGTRKQGADVPYSGSQFIRRKTLFDRPPETPLANGDLIGLAFRACRRNIPLVFKVLFVPTIFLTIGALGAQWVFSYGISSVAATKDIVAAMTMFLIASVSSVVLAVAGWIIAIRQLALVRLLLGFSANWKDAYGFVWRRKWAVIGIGLLASMFLAVAIAGGVIVMVISALIGTQGLRVIPMSIGMIIGGVAITFSVILYWLVNFVALCMLACEDEPIMSTLGRSLQLMVRYFWRALGFSLVLLLAFTIIGSPLSLPMVIATGIDMFRSGVMSGQISETYKAPIYLMVFNQVWDSLMSLVLRPVAFFAFGLLYYDLRLRSEGLDIKRRLADLKARAAA